MEFFDSETDHMRYLGTLSGRYTYRSRAFRIMLVLVFAGTIFLLRKLNTFYPVYIISAVILLLMIFAGNIPCSYKADELGFTICSGLIARTFLYSDVNSVAVENKVCGHTKGGGTVYENVLTVSTDRRIYRFREKCGIVRRRSLRYAPDSDQVIGRHTELIRLNEFIKTRILACNGKKRDMQAS